jgi:hypothetical protein
MGARDAAGDIKNTDRRERKAIITDSSLALAKISTTREK